MGGPPACGGKEKPQRDAGAFQRWGGALSAARGIVSVATTQSMAAIYVNSIFMVAKFADIVKYRSYIY
jgi:hypothetical protein